MTRYLIRYRFVASLFASVVVASGFALNWNWLTAAGLLPILAFLPCMVMMFMCMKHGTHKSDDGTALSDKTFPSRFPTSSDPPH
jgi:hypothetical protein